MAGIFFPELPYFSCFRSFDSMRRSWNVVVVAVVVVAVVVVVLVVVVAVVLVVLALFL